MSRTEHNKRPGTGLTGWAKAAIVGLGALALAAGCVTAPPKELEQARAMYRRAATGPARELAPEQLSVARSALKRAEKEYRANPAGMEVKDYSYLAQREAMLAESKASIEASNQQLAQAQRDLQIARSRATDQQGEELAQAREKLEAERRAREEAEMRAQEAERSVRAALDRLGSAAKVREEERGTVISLSGSVLFTSGSHNLMPAAQRRLEQVADALKQDTSHTILIEGHTDSVGSEEFNENLSLKRAESVRDYLIRRGIPSERVEAVGLGESQPVADNSTPSGRANNRRVEIVLQRPQA